MPGRPKKGDAPKPEGERKPKPTVFVKGIGGPAKGNGMGPGWGGPPKGKTITFEEVNERNTRKNPPKTEAAKAKLRKLAETNDARLAQMMDVWGEVALNSKNEMARIVAAEKIYDRIDGKPMQKNLNINADGSNLSFEDMVRMALERPKPIVLIEGEKIERDRD